eukprot:TRINITY_DN48_c2_g1_i2.p1 TRINITY_DN48_c2_g1~~TRINITY_DN48_c2_g1_i2.p1  ORF type:complete len:413 (+),score=80.50 TRINITY_DN48_c2_g1_i2:24-1262(+)
MVEGTRFGEESTPKTTTTTAAGEDGTTAVPPLVVVSGEDAPTSPGREFNSVVALVNTANLSRGAQAAENGATSNETQQPRSLFHEEDRSKSRATCSSVIRDTLRVHNKHKAAALALRVLMLASVTCTVIVAVVVPWYLAKLAGEDSVKKAISPLLYNVATKAQASVEQFFSVAVAAAAEVERLCKTFVASPAGVYASDFKALELELLQIGTRLSGTNYIIRYMYWAGLNGEMACVEFDKATRSEFIQEVRFFQNGTLSNQMNWQLDEDGNPPTGYPTSNYDDMGPYDVLEWVPSYLAAPCFLGDAYTEITPEGDKELLIMHFTPVVNAAGEYVGIFGVDTRAHDVAELFRENVEQQQQGGGKIHGVAFLTEPDGIVIATSVEEPTITENMTLRYCYDFEDELVCLLPPLFHT